MSIFDIVLIVIIAAFTWNGLSKGIIRLIGNLVGLVVGAYLASHFYLNAYDWLLSVGWLKGWLAANAGAAKIIVFIVLFALIDRLVGLLAVIVEQFFKFIAVIPGSRYLNNLLGALLGFLEGSLFLGLIIYVASRYTSAQDPLGAQLAASAVVPILLKITILALPFLPAALKALKSLIY